MAAANSGGWGKLLATRVLAATLLDKQPVPLNNLSEAVH